MSKRMNGLKGLGTALITPFKADGSVDYDALARLLDTQLTGFVDYIVVLGTTGEAATMSAEEKKEVRRFIVNYVKGKLPLVLGVGGNNTALVLSELEAMRDELILDFAAILSVCPYYNKPNQEGLYQHFCAIAEASPIPVQKRVLFLLFYITCRGARVLTYCRKPLCGSTTPIRTRFSASKKQAAT